MVEEAIEAETGGEVDLDSESGALSVTGPDGETMEIGEGVTLPDDLSSLIPIYPDSTPLMVLRTGDGTQITLEVDEAASEVVSWYREQLAANGFEVKSDMVGPMGTVIAAEHADGTLMLTIMEVPNDNLTAITMIWDGGS